nr:alcohol dehydrogenase catalytic domain-containing protein [Angustibacter aerolatus]
MEYRGPYRIRVTEKDLPRIEHPNDAVVRVTRAAICGSDLHLYHGMMPDTRVGTTFGHEFVGVVHEVGPSVEHLQVGDRVMVPFNVYCGSCFFCARGLFSNCHNVNPNATAVGGMYGYSHTSGGYDGGQAEYVRVPLADVGPSLVPDWLDDDDAVLMTDALATGYFGAQARRRRGGRRRGGAGRRPGRAVRREVGVAHGSRPGDRGRPPRRAAREGTHLRPRRDAELHARQGRRGAPEARHRRSRCRRGDRLRGRGGVRQLRAARDVGAGSAAGRFAGGGQLGDRRRAQGRDGVDHGRLRPAVQRGQGSATRSTRA